MAENRRAHRCGSTESRLMSPRLQSTLQRREYRGYSAYARDAEKAPIDGMPTAALTLRNPDE